MRVNLLDMNRMRMPLPAGFCFNQEERKTRARTEYDRRRLSYRLLLLVGQPESLVGDKLTAAEENCFFGRFAHLGQTDVYV